MQIAGQLFAGFFVCFDDAQFFCFEPLVKLGILQGNDGLVGHAVEQLKMLFIEFNGRIRANDNRAKNLEAGPQRNAGGCEAAVKSDKLAQLRVLPGVVRGDGFGLSKRRPNDASFALHLFVKIYGRKAPRGHGNQIFAIKQKDSPHQ